MPFFSVFEILIFELESVHLRNDSGSARCDRNYQGIIIKKKKQIQLGLHQVMIFNVSPWLVSPKAQLALPVSAVVSCGSVHHLHHDSCRDKPLEEKLQA